MGHTRSNIRVHTLSDNRRHVSHRPSFTSRYSSSMESTNTDGREPTVREALNQGLATLKAKNIDEAEESVVNLLAMCMGLPWETGHRDLQSILCAPSILSMDGLGNRTLTPDQVESFGSLLRRRLQDEPIQYLVGKWDFYRHVFEIQRPLLCPRPETEQLVEMVENAFDSYQSTSTSSNNKEPLRILDVGAGTGCIGISLAAAAFDKKLPIRVHAIDIEPVAIETSRRNAESILGDTWNDLYSLSLVSATEYDAPSDFLFDMVVSNPPYIPQRDYEQLEATVKNYESPDALVAGDDGMDVIRIILEKLPTWARSGASCWMEVDPSQPEMIRALCESSSLRDTLEYMETIQDVFGKDRFVKIRLR